MPRENVPLLELYENCLYLNSQLSKIVNVVSNQLLRCFNKTTGPTSHLRTKSEDFYEDINILKEIEERLDRVVRGGDGKCVAFNSLMQIVVELEQELADRDPFLPTL